jgi:signal transduction histidine kinase
MLLPVSTSAASLFQRESRYGPLTDQQKRIIERILRNVRKAQTLLNEMIEISRSEEGLFQKELFPIEEILKEFEEVSSGKEKEEGWRKFFRAEK